MRTNKHCLLIGISSLIFVGCTTLTPPVWNMAAEDSSNFQKIGVFAFALQKYADAKIHPQLESLVAGELINKGYTVVDRTNLRDTVHELKNQQGDLFNQMSAQELGELLGVQALMHVASYEKKGEKSGENAWSIRAKLILVERNEVIGTCSFSAATDVLLFRKLPSFEKFVELFMSGFPET